MLTDKSTIPLSVNDLRVIEGERCFLDRRLNLRLGYDRGTNIRALIRRHKKDFEARFGPLRHREAVVKRAQGGGNTETEYWLTKGQTLWALRKSDAPRADDVMEEVIKVFLAVDAGAPIPDTPWTDALFAPDKPTIEHGPDNVIQIKHDIWKQPDLFIGGRNVCETFEVSADDCTGRATVSYNDSGSPVQVGFEQVKTNAETLAFYDHNAALTTILMQYGVPLETIRDALGRNQDGKSATLIGALLEKICPQ